MRIRAQIGMVLNLGIFAAAILLDQKSRHSLAETASIATPERAPSLREAFASGTLWLLFLGGLILTVWFGVRGVGGN